MVTGPENELELESNVPKPAPAVKVRLVVPDRVAPNVRLLVVAAIVLDAGVNAMARLTVWRFEDEFVMPPERLMAFPLIVKAPAPLLNVMPEKEVFAVMVFEFVVRVFPAKNNASPATGAVLLSQLLFPPPAPPLQLLLKAEPPSQVLLAATADPASMAATHAIKHAATRRTHARRFDASGFKAGAVVRPHREMSDRIKKPMDAKSRCAIAWTRAADAATQIP
jgi:hypothetical protein